MTRAGPVAIIGGVPPASPRRTSPPRKIGPALDPFRAIRLRPRALATLVALAFAAACDSPSAPDGDGAPAAVRITSDAGPASLLDPVEILAAEVSGDRLTIVVGYAGGCAEHAFEALAPPDFTTADAIELPIWLRHDARGDACEAYVERTLEFDLAAVRGLWFATFGAPGLLRLRVVAPGNEVTALYDLRAFTARS